MTATLAVGMTAATLALGSTQFSDRESVPKNHATSLPAHVVGATVDEGAEWWSSENPAAALSIRIPHLSKAPQWLRQVVSRLEYLLSLPENWDSYGAQRPDPRRYALGLKILADVMQDEYPQPSIVPTASGGVQFEWHINQIDLEIEVETIHKVMVFFEDLEVGEEWEGEASKDLTPVISTLARIAQRMKLE